MKKIWQKTEWSEINKIIEEYTVWNDYILDMELIPYDILGSQAHVKMLYKIWVLQSEEKETLLEWLDKIAKLHNNWEFIIEKHQEDGHTAIETFLTQNYWEVGKKIHTGRSRNDQILITTRLFTLDKLDEILTELDNLVLAFEKKIESIWDILMPGYTHTQRAMPTTIWTWLGSFKDSLSDNKILIEAAKKVNNQNPLGSVAGFWEDVFWLDRDFVSAELWIEKTQKNPMYCAYSRGKFENIVLQSLSQVMLDLWKLANDMVYFSSREFDFLTLPDDFKTGSSVMPQKKNWDIMELVRWNSNLFQSYEFAIKEVFKNLLSGYNRDYQLTKEPYLKWVKLTLDTIKVCNVTIQNLWVKEDSLKNACTQELYATQEAYELVKQGKTFRDAYIEIWKKYM